VPDENNEDWAGPNRANRSPANGHDVWFSIRARGDKQQSVFLHPLDCVSKVVCVRHYHFRHFNFTSNFALPLDDRRIVKKLSCDPASGNDLRPAPVMHFCTMAGIVTQTSLAISSLYLR
jgi:hypothetical protein